MNKSSLYKGCLEPIVLQLLRSNRRMYGYEITQKVKELTKGELQITEGALYPLLHRLEAEGVLESEMQIAENRMRKYYSLTKTGKEKAGSAMEALRAFLQTMELLTKLTMS
jgi:PadR family transcriptional regulator